MQGPEFPGFFYGLNNDFSTLFTFKSEALNIFEL
jgi:hypothetical protein